MAAIPSIWLCRKLRQVVEAGPCRRIMYLPTVAWLTFIPSPYRKLKIERIGDVFRRGSAAQRSRQNVAVRDALARPCLRKDEFWSDCSKRYRPSKCGAGVPPRTRSCDRDIPAESFR